MRLGLAEGCTYVQVALTLGAAGYCHQVELHRRDLQVWFVPVRTMEAGPFKAGTFRPEKRLANPDGMVVHRHVRARLQHLSNRHQQGSWSAETQGSAPLLLSRPVIQALDTVLDLGKNAVSFQKIVVSGLPPALALKEARSLGRELSRPQLGRS